MAGKLVELLKEMAPRLGRWLFFSTRRTSAAAGYRRSIETVARSLGVIPVWLPIRNAAESWMRHRTFAGEPQGGLVLPTDVTTVVVTGDLIVTLAARHRLRGGILVPRGCGERRADVATGRIPLDLFQRAAS